jgi:hypothetical protein
MEVPTTVGVELDLVLNVGSTDWKELDLELSLTAEGGQRVWLPDTGDGES